MPRDHRLHRALDAGARADPVGEADAAPRPRRASPAPARDDRCGEAQLPASLIGRLELTAGRPEAAADELCAAVARADAIELLWMRGWARIDLAVAMAS
jgi:hypothetical protein